jgi:hypothetical protein
LCFEIGTNPQLHFYNGIILVGISERKRPLGKRVILKWVVKKQNINAWNAFGSGLGVATNSEHGNKSSDPTKGDQFLRRS